jgi:hypothetical protein
MSSQHCMLMSGLAGCASFAVLSACSWYGVWYGTCKAEHLMCMRGHVILPQLIWVTPASGCVASGEAACLLSCIWSCVLCTCTCSHRMQCWLNSIWHCVCHVCPAAVDILSLQAVVACAFCRWCDVPIYAVCCICKILSTTGASAHLCQVVWAILPRNKGPYYHSNQQLSLVNNTAVCTEAIVKIVKTWTNVYTPTTVTRTTNC